jgi:hypothetical protein
MLQRREVDRREETIAEERGGGRVGTVVLP